jgi:hypothetical protein
MPSIISTKTSGGGGIAVTGDTSGVLQLASNDGTTAVTIDASQNVLVGTSTAYAPFSVEGTASGGTAWFRHSGGNSFGTIATFETYAGTDDPAISLRNFNGGSTQQYSISCTDAGGIAFNAGGGASAFGNKRLEVTSAGLLQFNSGYGSVATAYGCRAWVNFNGTGTVAIRASGNVTSITDNGTGNYTVNFTNAMPDANYTTVATCSSDTDGFLKVVALNSRSGSSVDPTTTAQRIYTRVSGTNSDSDTTWVEVSVFR